MKLIYLKSALKCDSFDVAIDIKIPFSRVLVTIEPDRSLLQFVTTNCLIKKKVLDPEDFFYQLVKHVAYDTLYSVIESYITLVKHFIYITTSHTRIS